MDYVGPDKIYLAGRLEEPGTWSDKKAKLMMLAFPEIRELYKKANAPDTVSKTSKMNKK